MSMLPLNCLVAHPCPDKWTITDRYCYRTITETVATLAEAKTMCAALTSGSALVTIHNSADNIEITSVLNRSYVNTSFYIGLTLNLDAISNGQGEWLNLGDDKALFHWDGAPVTGFLPCAYMNMVDGKISGWLTRNCEQPMPSLVCRLPVRPLDKFDKLYVQLKTLEAIMYDTSVPIGFVYLQLPNQLAPVQVWGSRYKWADVTKAYAGLFLRAESGGSAAANETGATGQTAGPRDTAVRVWRRKLLGFICGVNLSPELSYGAMYAVRQEYQGLGIGSTLCDKLIVHFGDRNVCVYAGDQKMYNKYKDLYKFNAIPQRKRLIMKGKPVVNGLTASIRGISLVDMNDKNIADVIEYDKQVCDGLDRSAQLRALNGRFENINSVAINDNNQVMGYCSVSETASGDPFVAPLYADNQQIAELLVGNCLQRITDWETKEIYYSCWDSNPESLEIANKLGLKPRKQIPIMFTKKIIDGKLLGFICGVNLTPELSYWSMYAVRPEYQGLGIGSKLWDKLIVHFGDRNVCVYTGDEKTYNKYKDLYKFNAIPQRRRLVMKGKPVVNGLTDSIHGISLVDMNDSNIADVIEYDKQVCDGLDRSAQLRALNGRFENINSVAINDSNQVMGYCSVSETASGTGFLLMTHITRCNSLVGPELQFSSTRLSNSYRGLRPSIDGPLPISIKYTELIPGWFRTACMPACGQNLAGGEFVENCVIYENRTLIFYLVLRIMCEKTMPSYTIRTMQLSDCNEVQEIWISVELSYGAMYAVKQEYQGLGIGSTLCDKLIEHFGDRNVCIYAGDQTMYNKYKDLYKFNAIPQRKRLLMKGKPVVNGLTDSIHGISLVDMNDNNIADVIEYDKQVCDGLDRTVQLRALNGRFENINSVAINDNNQYLKTLLAIHSLPHFMPIINKSLNY
ncbi:unnamed protein product [Medioppia subpectinata]|uniref:C-type lectin domain-containing protein n=1 Tax=Medioppia subpectinata TaxID=1979941 RepID=A0A7R9KGY6_9ACAR|nr:unnamed protein product [Medioppia subpectinata]CAG2103218.1 unnamed protein product [Medioppia subpectinata]